MSREAAGRPQDCMGASGPPAAPQLPRPAAGTWRVWPRAGPRPGPPRLKLGPRREGARGPRAGHETSCCPVRAWWGEPGCWAGVAVWAPGACGAPAPWAPLVPRVGTWRAGAQFREAKGSRPHGQLSPLASSASTASVGCLAAPHPLSSPGPSVCLSMATGTLPCLAPAWSPLPCAGSALAPPEQKPCLGPGLSLASLPALTALQASTVPGAGSQARPSPACSLSWAPLPTQGSLKAEGCGGRQAASPLRAGTPTSGSVLATADGRQWGAAGRAGLPPSAGRRLVMGGGGFLLWLSRGLRLSCSPSGGWTRGRGVGSLQSRGPVSKQDRVGPRSQGAPPSSPLKAVGGSLGPAGRANTTPSPTPTAGSGLASGQGREGDLPSWPWDEGDNQSG